MDNRVAIFIDAENLTQWIKMGGLDGFLEELTSLGSVVVRKAYAKWTSTSVTAHQAALNRLGFELIHCFHPVSGKNSADIQIAVDVMEYAAREELRCIALATGDSDFSPLFRRLRELGKQVVGAGPRSALSEAVKSSCSRFVYTDLPPEAPGEKEATLTAAFDDAADLLESALKTFAGPANLSGLKSRMLDIDSAFDEKNLRFKSFTDFVKAVPGVSLEQHHNTGYVTFQEAKGPKAQGAELKVPTEHEVPPPDLTDPYRNLLRRKHWRSLPASLLVRCFNKLQSVGDLPRSEMAETASVLCEGGVTTTDMRKAANLLIKAGLMEAEGKNEEGEMLWRVSKTANDSQMMRAVDKAMLVRLLDGLHEVSTAFSLPLVSPLLVGKYTAAELESLVGEARKARRAVKGDDPTGKQTGSEDKPKGLL